MTAEIDDAVPQRVVSADAFVFGDAPARKPGLLRFRLIEGIPEEGGIDVVVLAVHVHTVLTHHLCDAAESPLKAIRISKEAAGDRAEILAPFIFIAVVFHKVVHMRHPIGLEPCEHLHARLMAGVIGLPKAVSGPFYPVQPPAADGAEPVFFHAAARRVRIPARVEPAEIGNDPLPDQLVKSRLPRIIPFRNASVGVGQPGVARKAGGGKGH